MEPRCHTKDVEKATSLIVICAFLRSRYKGGICIPNSTTEVWTVIDVDLLVRYKITA